MPTGTFQIGDLTFQHEGTLKELADCQQVIREFNEASYRLKKASGADKVKIIYDDNLEGDAGTFDKMRLRAYSGDLSYTLDIGETDTNPLGVYVGSSDNIEVYNRKTKEDWEITPEGEVIGREGQGDGAPTKQNSGRQQQTSRKQRSSREQSSPGKQSSAGKQPQTGKQTAQSNGQTKTSSQGPVKGDDREGSSGAGSPETEGKGSAPDSKKRSQMADRLLKKAGTNFQEGDKKVQDIQMSKGEPLAGKISGFIDFCGRSEGYAARALDVVGAPSTGEIALEDLELFLDMITSQDVLVRHETEEDGEIPF